MMAHRNRNAQYVFQTEVIQNLDWDQLQKMPKYY